MNTPLSEPLYFGPEDRPLFGWLHRAATPGQLGVVLCNPFGYEAICAHRSLRRFAEAAAAAGAAALRFDYDGTGDSSGDDRDPDRLRSWVASVGQAIDALRQHAGVERICLLGVRLGALIAALAAQDRGEEVAGLIAIAPVVSGKAYFRELRLQQSALGLGEPPAGVVVDPEMQEAVGFVIAPETRDALVKVDLPRQTAAPAPAVLILDREDLPAAGKWAERLTALGAAVEMQRLPGYVEMVLDPHDAAVPEKMVSAAAGWLRERVADLPVAPSAAAGSPPAALTPPAAPPRAEARPTAAVAEQAVFVDAERLLFGVLSTPATAPRSGRAILLLNAGAVHHVGPNRLYTALARRWAALGHVVLRFDISGIGDSRTRPGDDDNIVYSPRASRDVAAAIAFLRGQAGVIDCYAVGLCSGAYHAFKAAVAGQPLDGVIAINPLTFFWDESQSLNYPAFRVASDAERYGRSLLSFASWKKLLSGRVRIEVAAQTMGRYAASLLVGHARDLSRLVGMPWHEDVGAELYAIANRKVDLRFVFVRGDPGLSLLRTQGGSAVRRLLSRERLSITVIDGPDHTFTPVWSHANLTAALAAVLDAPAAFPGARR